MDYLLGKETIKYHKSWENVMWPHIKLRKIGWEMRKLREIRCAT